MIRLLYPLVVAGVLALGWLWIAEPAPGGAADDAALLRMAGDAVPHAGGQLAQLRVGRVPGGGRLVCGVVERQGERRAFYVAITGEPPHVAGTFLEGRDEAGEAVLAGFCPR